MPIPYLSMFAVVSFALAVAALIYELKKYGKREFVKYLVAGMIVAGFDFFIEYLGTSVNNWAYHHTLYFLFGLVPAELLLLFFAAGVIARFLYKKSERVPALVSLNAMFYILILLGSLTYTRDLYILEIKSNILYLAVPVGMWGIVNIHEEKNRVSALAIAATLAVFDALVESFFIRRGAYVYAGTDFPWQVPLVYALLALGFFGLLGKVEKLDKLFDYPLVRGWLRLLGVRRELYGQKVRQAVAKAKKNINGARE